MAEIPDIPYPVDPSPELIVDDAELTREHVELLHQAAVVAWPEAAAALASFLDVP